jgi:aminoglycoside phosphotransferase (APT) family kinase protein
LCKGSEALDDLLQRAETDLDRATANGLIGAQAMLIRRRLWAGVNRTSLDVSGLCLHHGDFWPGNVFIDGEEVTVFDFEGWREGLPLEDAAYFTLQLELAFPVPILRRRGRRYSAAFLETYVGEERFDAELYRSYRIAKALQILSHHGEGPGVWSLAEGLRVKLLVDVCVHD